MAADFTRDRWGRPLIIPADGGKAIAYGRFSSHGSVLEDKFALEKWKIRTSVSIPQKAGFRFSSTPLSFAFLLLLISR